VQDTPLPERKQRKSVAFTNEQVVVDADGSVTMVNSPDEVKETAQSHTPRTPPLSAALGAFTDTVPPVAGAEQVPDVDASAEAPAADDGGLDLTLKKKKKKKVVLDDDEEAAPAADGAAEDGGIDLSLKKKKKKKVAAPADDDFAAKLKALELEGKTDEAGAAAEAEEPVDEGDMETGTGIWQHDETKPIAYSLLLDRFFFQLTQKNPDHASSGSKSYKIPPPQCLREGNKKTIFANIAEIAKRMKRTEEHVTQYLVSIKLLVLFACR
jgi:translation initiation factor 2 subunit 2